MKENALVSIVIPVYNREKLIVETVNSAIFQSYCNIEIIIVDNKSTDNTWQVIKNIAKSDSRIKIYQNDENIGPARNWIKCLEYAQGEYTKILFSDDLIKYSFVEKTMNVFDEDTAFVMTGIKFFGGVSYESCFQKRYPVVQDSSEYIKESVTNYFSIFSYPVSPGCAIFRTKDLRNNLLINIPNTDNLQFDIFGAGNDLLLFLLTAQNYEYVKTIPECEALFRHHDESFSVKSNLLKYYDWSRYYFVNKYRKDLILHFSVVANFHKKKYYNESSLILKKLSITWLKYSILFTLSRIFNKFYAKFVK